MADNCKEALIDTHPGCRYTEWAQNEMSIHQCFERGTVVTDLDGNDKYEALRQLIRKAPVFGEITSIESFEKAVIEREKLQSTGLGHEVAVAHGRAPGVKRVLIALGVSREGIAYESPDGRPVRLLFVIASPLHVSLDYLQALSTLVRFLRHPHVRDELLAGDSSAEIESRLRAAFAEGLPAADPLAGREPCSTAG
jgi:nitrogen PTS system EIIA component